MKDVYYKIIESGHNKPLLLSIFLQGFTEQAVTLPHNFVIAGLYFGQTSCKFFVTLSQKDFVPPLVAQLVLTDFQLVEIQNALL